MVTEALFRPHFNPTAKARISGVCRVTDAICALLGEQTGRDYPLHWSVCSTQIGAGPVGGRVSNYQMWDIRKNPQNLQYLRRA